MSLIGERTWEYDRPWTAIAPGKNCVETKFSYSEQRM